MQCCVYFSVTFFMLNLNDGGTYSVLRVDLTGRLVVRLSGSLDGVGNFKSKSEILILLN